MPGLRKTFGNLYNIAGWYDESEELHEDLRDFNNREHVRILREALTEANERIKALSPDGYIAPERWRIEYALEATKEGA